MAWLGWRAATSRLVADAAGLHARNGFRTHHLAWPPARGFLVAALSGNSAVRYTVQYCPADGGRRVLIWALRRRSRGEERAIQEIVDLWEWASARGYVSRAEPPEGTLAAQRPAPVTPSARAHPAPAAYGVMPAASPTPLAAPPDPAAGRLVFRQELLPRWAALALAALICGGAALAAIRVLKRGNVVDTVFLGIEVLIPCALSLVALALAMRVRVVVDGKGIHSRVMRTVHLPWPASRHDLFVSMIRGSSLVIAMAACAAPDGKRLRLIGLVASGSDPMTPVRVADRLDAIWAWGLARGLVRDGAPYRPCADAALERERALSHETIRDLRGRASGEV